MAIEFETPGMKIPYPTAADDGKVLGFTAATWSLGWVAGDGASGFSGINGASGFSGINGVGASGFSGY